MVRERTALGSGCAKGTAVTRTTSVAANEVNVVGSQVGTLGLPA